MATLPNAVTLANIADGAAIVASDHRNNYSAVQTFLNSLQTILAAGTSGQVLTSGGGTTVQWNPTLSPVVARKTTAKAVNTTVTPTDLLNGEVTIGAGVLGTTGLLRLTAWGDTLHNTGGSDAIQAWSVALGATTVLAVGNATGTYVSSAVRLPWRITVTVQQLGAANAQTVSIEAVLYSGPASAGAAQSANNVFSTGEGVVWSAGNGNGYNQIFVGGLNTTAIDMASAQALKLNVTNGASNASYETKLLGAIVEVL